MSLTLQADSKGRLNLGKKYASTTFLLEEVEPGELVLTKAAIIPERELWLLKDPESMQAIQAGLEDAREGRLTKMDTTEFDN